MKGLLALVGTFTFLGVSVSVLMTRRGVSSVLLALGCGSFAVMALTHVFEAYSLLPRLGWGKPHTVGHFIDLITALLGITLVGASFLLRSVQRQSRGKDLEAL